MPPKKGEVVKGYKYKQGAAFKDVVPKNVTNPPREGKPLKVP